MGITAQQVYIPTRHAGPDFLAAVRQLADNPLAKYTLLQQRRQRQRRAAWAQWLILALSAVAGLLSSFVALPRLQNWLFGYAGAGWPWYGTLALGAVSSGLFWYGLWLVQGVFTAVRDIAMMLSDAARGGRAAGVDELVAVSPLNDNEVLAACLRIGITPLLGRVLTGAGILVILNAALPLLLPESLQLRQNIQALSLNEPVHLGEDSTGSAAPVAAAALPGHPAASTWQLLRQLSGWSPLLLLNTCLITVHGVISSLLLLMFLLVASRRISTWGIATAAGALNASMQYAYFSAMIWFSTYQLFRPERINPANWWLAGHDQLRKFCGDEVAEPLLIILISVIVIALGLRLLRNSRLLRYLALAIPVQSGAAVVLALLILAGVNTAGVGVQTIVQYTLPGLLAFTASLNLADYLGSPYLIIAQESMQENATQPVFNPFWLVKLAVQLLFFPVLLVLARDAVRLSRQPGTL